MNLMEGGDYSNGDKLKKSDNAKGHSAKDIPGIDLWKDGLICAFEYVRSSRGASREKFGASSNRNRRYHGSKKHASKSGTRAYTSNLNGISLIDSTSLIDFQDAPINTKGIEATDSSDNQAIHVQSLENPRVVMENIMDRYWVPIGWARIQELVQMVKVDSGRNVETTEFADDEDDLTVADVAAPYWEKPAGPTWWCHVDPLNPAVVAWLKSSQWLHPAVSIALTNESRLISERMKHLFYEVPVRVAGGLLFELLGQSVGDPHSYEDDTPIVLRSWQAQNFLVTALHIKGNSSNVNILGITEVQEILFTGGYGVPKSIHEVISHLACRLSRWDDRLFRKYIFGAADEVELMFVQWRNHEDLNLLSRILNQEIRRLSKQVIRVKWSLHAREEIIFELLQHLRGTRTNSLLEGIRKSTRQMIEEQEAVRNRIFTIQDVIQSTVRAWLQDRSLRVTHNLTVFGGCGLVLSVVTGLFGINVDGMPGAQNTPYAFGLFSGLLLLLGVILIALGMLYLGIKRPIKEQEVAVRKLELQQLITKFQHDAEHHAKVRDDPSRINHMRNNLPPTAADMLGDKNYIILA